MHITSPFRAILINTLIAVTATNFLWFSLTFWMYLETRSVLANAIINGMFPLLSAVAGMALGTYVDHHKKKQALKWSGRIALISFGFATCIYTFTSHNELTNIHTFWFWAFVISIMFGAVAGNLRSIALSTLVTMLVPEPERDKANGHVGSINGMSFAITSVVSGMAIAFLGMQYALYIALILTAATLIHLRFVHFNDDAHTQHTQKITFDISGTFRTIRSIPGLLALMIFSLINNFMGGVFFALMDPYGLELVSVQTWGILLGILSFSFLVGSTWVAKKGLGTKPLRTLFIVNIITWSVSIIFPLQPSIILLCIGMFFYMSLSPVVEAAEQTVFQKVVPLEKQGRVFGFGQTLENMATPLSAFASGTLAQTVFIPFMTSGQGVQLIGNWFGTGAGRGMGLFFICASVLGLVVTLIAFGSPAYRILSKTYRAAR